MSDKKLEEEQKIEENSKIIAKIEGLSSREEDTIDKEDMSDMKSILRKAAGHFGENILDRIEKIESDDNKVLEKERKVSDDVEKKDECPTERRSDKWSPMSEQNEDDFKHSKF